MVLRLTIIGLTIITSEIDQITIWIGGTLFSLVRPVRHQTTTHRLLWRSNYFFEADGDFELISNKSTGNKYQYNTFVASRGLLTLRQGNNVLVDSNFFFGNGKGLSGGIRVRGEGHRITNNYL